MRLERASNRAMDIACLNYHYSKIRPTAGSIGYSVFNGKGEFCGVIIFGIGAAPKLGNAFGLVSGEFRELTRVALNGKQESTSKAVSIALRLLKKDQPLVRVVFSFADMDQNHYGIIYQATNWYYMGETSKGAPYFIDKSGKKRHNRIVGECAKKMGITFQQAVKYLEFKKLPGSNGKRKYVYFIDRSLIEKHKDKFLDYPKENANIV